MGDQIHQVAAERGVLIVGPQSLQNKLLAKLIGERTGYPCEQRAAGRPNGDLPGGALLVLLDAAEYGSRMAAICASGIYSTIAVINADASAGCEEFVSYPGVKGLFYADVSEEQLIKGIEAIFNGEYWLTRRLLCGHLERTRTVPDSADSPLSNMLTRKEIQTLRLLATGSTTDHIAHALKVSPHTVKTHIYNLFRKINVSNRVQAVHWATRHMVIADLSTSR